MNSRVFLQDLLKTSTAKGLEIMVRKKVLKIDESRSQVEVITSDGTFHSRNVVICSPDVIAKDYNVSIKTGFAPMAIVENVPEAEVSFVELDYYQKTCINLIKKNNGIAQIGGITLDKESEAKSYLEYLITEHKKRNPGIKVLDTFMGIKKELLRKGQDRNYLYHINQNSDRVWSIVLGKFTLAFSMAPEFYRRVFNRNPVKDHGNVNDAHDSKILSDTSWQEIVAKKNIKDI